MKKSDYEWDLVEAIVFNTLFHCLSQLPSLLSLANRTTFLAWLVIKCAPEERRPSLTLNLAPPCQLSQALEQLSLSSSLSLDYAI